jgi:hypothetical protein
VRAKYITGKTKNQSRPDDEAQHCHVLDRVKRLDHGGVEREARVLDVGEAVARHLEDPDHRADVEVDQAERAELAVQQVELVHRHPPFFMPGHTCSRSRT